MNYYDEIINVIGKLIDENNVDKALSIIDEELSMPYIPINVEEQLHNFKSICKSKLNASEMTILKEDALTQALLHGTLDQQYQAVESLNVSNARQYCDLIQQALQSGSVDQEVKVGLVHVLKDQCISNVYGFKLNEKYLTFNLDDVVDYLQPNNVIDQFDEYVDLIITDNPSFNQLVKQMIFDCLVHLFPIQIVSVNDYKMVLKQVLQTAIMASSLESCDYMTKMMRVMEQIESQN